MNRSITALALFGTLACSPTDTREPTGARSAALVATTGTRITQPTPLDGDDFGMQLALSGDTLLATSRFFTPMPPGEPTITDRVHFFELSAGTWSEVATFDGLADETFGAGLAIDGDWAAVGSRGHASGNGRVVIYERAAGTWSQHTVLTNPTAPQQALFGLDVAIDGTTLAVAAPGYDDPGVLNVGSVYIYVLSGSTWSLEERIAPPASVENGSFGRHVALSGDTLATTEDIASTNRAYAFARSGTVWSEQAQLVTGEANVQGYGRAIDADGDHIVVGSPNTVTTVANAGGTHVFERTGTTWSETAVLRNESDPNPNFGGAVAIVGPNIASGAHSWASTRGNVFLHELAGGAWSEDDDFADDNPDLDRFGQSLSLDGTRLAVGAHEVAAMNIGVVFVYDLVDDLTDATPCVRNSQCASDFCVEGVCCDAACDGLCESCLQVNTGQPDGTCAPNTADTDPDSECTDDGAPACTQDGQCDGAGACAMYTDPLPTCSPRPCTDDAECTSGRCAIIEGEPSGICCDEACTGDCESCRAADHGANAQDGLCQPIAAGADPKDRCDPEGAACAADGQCDGAGACRTFAPEGTSCGTSACSETLATVPECDGAGSCVPSQTSCSPYACAGDACGTDCQTDSGCAEGFLCDANECVASVKRCSADGTTVITPGEPDEECAPYVCEGDACLTSCTSTSDCASNRVCDTDERRCVKSGSGSDDGGCGCRTVGSREPAPWMAALLAAWVWGWRRRGTQ